MAASNASAVQRLLLVRTAVGHSEDVSTRVTQQHLTAFDLDHLTAVRRQGLQLKHRDKFTHSFVSVLGTATNHKHGGRQTQQTNRLASFYPGG